MSNPTLQIPKDVIEPIIQANITAAIAQAMGNGTQVIQQAIASILATSVDSEGKPSSYGNSRRWIDWAVGDSLRKAAKAAIDEHIAAHREAIQKQLVAELSKKNSPLIKSMVEGMMKSCFSESNLKYRLTVTAE
jgi:hypothetical protein